jgi:hypothetical protein
MCEDECCICYEPLHETISCETCTFKCCLKCFKFICVLKLIKCDVHESCKSRSTRNLGATCFIDGLNYVMCCPICRKENHGCLDTIKGQILKFVEKEGGYEFKCRKSDVAVVFFRVHNLDISVSFLEYVSDSCS